MRKYIDLVSRLDEDVVPFPGKQRAAAMAKKDHFRMLVLMTTEQRPRGKLIDQLTDLSAEEVAKQLRNYHPQQQRDNIWVSRQGGNTYYIQVLLGDKAPSEDELADIQQQQLDDD